MTSFKRDLHRLRSVVCVALGLIWTAQPVWSQNTEYTFTPIADTVRTPGVHVEGLTCVGLNNLGTVVIVAPHLEYEFGIWRGTDHLDISKLPVNLPPNTVAAAFLCTSINDLGEIAHFTVESSVIVTLVRNSNGSLTPLASSGTPPYLHMGLTYLPSLTNGGSAVFASQGEPGPHTGSGIYVGPSGPSVVLDSPAFAAFDGSVSMNESLVFTFLAANSTGRWGIYRGSTVPLVEEGGPVIDLVSLHRPVINNQGTVAFFGRRASDGQVGVFKTDDGLAFEFVGTGDPDTTLSINDLGTVAYRSAIGQTTAIMTGPDAVADRVIGTGDPLDGSTVLLVRFWPEALNDRGQVAFFAELADGRRGVYRADPINHPPVASNGTLTTPEDTPENGTLSASDADSDPLIYSILSNGTKGVATVTNSATGAFTYSPNADVNGSDSFVFRAYDGVNNSNEGTIFVTITPVNDAPVATNGTASVDAGASVGGTLVATDIDNASLTYTVETNGTKGSAVITNASTGAYTYTANAGSSGTDTFTFQANDGFLPSNVATVTVTITANCAADISASVALMSKGPLKLDRKTGRYTQTLTLRNGDGPVSGPVSLALDGLTGNVTLFNASGATTCIAPLGSPYSNVGVGSDAVFSPGERATITLEFNNPSGQAVTYTTRVLAGAGTR